jgi:succinate dehydrogenase / fumarate reductase cytochrome b subunit
MTDTETRPKFLNIARIHLPVMAVLSLGHRLSGILLVLMLPLLVYLLELSLAGSQGFSRALAIVDSSWSRIFLVFALWVLAHHVFAGIRYLLIDLDIGVDLRAGRASAWLVISAAVGVLLIGAWVLL